MKRFTFAVSTIGLLVSGYALPGRFADRASDLIANLLKAGFLLLFICSFIVTGYFVINIFRKRKANGIRTIRQYYLQRGVR